MRWLYLWLPLTIGLWWFGYGWFLVGCFTFENPEYVPGAMLSAAASALVIWLGHLGTLRLFHSRQAGWGFIIGLAASLPGVWITGWFMFAMGAMASDGGMEAAAKAAAGIIPFMIGVPAFCALLASFVGAAIGQATARQRQRSLQAETADSAGQG